MKQAHSWKFVPGQMQRMLDKAFGPAADVVMPDLEDSVVPAQKAAARALVAQALVRPLVAGSPTRYLRIKGIGLADCPFDLDAVLEPGLEGFVVPKVEGVWPDLDDTRGLEEDCACSRALGFTGKSLIQPSQIEPINRAFRPSADEFAQREEEG